MTTVFWRKSILDLPNAGRIVCYEPSRIVDKFPAFLEPEPEPLNGNNTTTAPGMYPVSDAVYQHLRATAWATWFAGRQTALQFAKRRARERGRAATFNREDFQRAVIYFDGLCPVCEVRLCRPRGIDADREWSNQITLDHWKPLANGGDTSPGNCLPMCNDCNKSKGDYDAGLWLLHRLPVIQATRTYAAILDYLQEARNW